VALEAAGLSVRLQDGRALPQKVVIAGWQRRFDSCHHVRMARADRLTIGVQLAVGLTGAVAGIGTIAIARRAGLSFAASSTTAEVLDLAAGWALVLAGVLWLGSRARRRFGALLCAAGFAWFVVDWNNPETRSSVLFTAGLVLSTVCPAVVAHAALRDAAPRLYRIEALLVAVAYVSTLLVSGLLPAMLFDPARQGCNECPGNLVAVRSDPILLDHLSRAGTLAGVGWTGAVIVALARRVTTSSRARRGIIAGVCVPAAAYLTAVGLDDWHSIKRGFVGDDTVDHRLRLIESVALIALALGSGWAVLRRRLTRAAVARLVVDAAATPPAAGLENALGAALGDPSLRIFYPLSDGRLVDSAGRESTPAAGLAVTPLVRSEAGVAVLTHRVGLLDADGVAEEVTRTARLALDNERLRAEARARLVDLRASRSRVVASAEAERRRLERDLHDGAQQQIVSLALGLQLATLQLDPAESVCRSRLEQARSEVAAALGELRALARGLYPRELADEGLAAGLETLAETSRASVVLRSVPEERYPPPVESAAYFTIASCAQLPNAQQIAVAVTSGDGRLCVDVETDVTPPDLTRLEDRVGALDGSIVLERLSPSKTGIRVELPCGS
jgi:signal transduction histidine kinase